MQPFNKQLTFAQKLAGETEKSIPVLKALKRQLVAGDFAMANLTMLELSGGSFGIDTKGRIIVL